jgi:hypothetical protein
MMSRCSRSNAFGVERLIAGRSGAWSNYIFLPMFGAQFAFFIVL